MSSPLFRQTALEKISSPEQLDQLMRVTRPRDWLALVALGTLLAGAVGWGILGSIPTRVYGSGVVLHPGEGLAEVQAKSPGRLTEVLLRPGDRVVSGQAVARIDRADLRLQLSQARAVADAIRTQRDETARSYAAYLREQERNLASQARNLRQQARDAEEGLTSQRQLLELRARNAAERVAGLGTLLQAQEDLLRDGFASKVQVQATRERVQAAREDLSKAESDARELVRSTQETLAKLRNDEQQLDIKLLDLKKERNQSLDSFALKLVEAEQRVAQVALDLEQAVTVVSHAAGTVVEVVAVAGTLLAGGAPVVRVDTGRLGLEAVIYAPSGQAKEIEVGMAAYVTPATVKKEEYGSIVGRVRAIGDLPATQAGMMVLLDNQDLVRTFLAAGPVTSVSVELKTDSSTVSGYQWSSGSGPRLKMSEGTLAAGEVVVRRQPPITLVIPALKKFFGLT